jgi:hypothetical protein
MVLQFLSSVVRGSNGFLLFVDANVRGNGREPKLLCGEPGKRRGENAAVGFTTWIARFTGKGYRAAFITVTFVATQKTDRNEKDSSPF